MKKVEELIAEARALNLTDLESIGKLLEKIEKLPNYAFVSFNEYTDDYANRLSNYYSSINFFQKQHNEFLEKMIERDKRIESYKEAIRNKIR